MAINLEQSVERSADRHTVNETDRLWLARFLADLLDQRFTIPGTSIRFGLDPIVSLIPGVGDLLQTSLDHSSSSSRRNWEFPKSFSPVWE